MIIIDNTVCERIADFRKKRNLTREELASNVGIRLNLLIQVEDGSRIPRINEIVQLATGLGISIEELVGRR